MRVGKLFGFTLPRSPTQFDFWILLPASQEAAELFGVRLTDSHLPTLTMRSFPEQTYYPKTVIVVTILARIVVVADRGTAVIRIVTPRTAPQSGSPSPNSTPYKDKGIEYLFP